jgi:hypothetical protein
MRFIFFLLLTYSCFIERGYSQSNNCTATINIDAAIFPDKLDSNFSCPVGSCCYTQVRSMDSRLKITSFKLSGYKICGREEEVLEIENKGNTFNGAAMSIIIKACSSILEFTCIKAISKAGVIYILKPFTITIK